jgi:hypothetical protein
MEMKENGLAKMKENGLVKMVYMIVKAGFDNTTPGC